MPHRIHFLSTAMGQIAEGLALLLGSMLALSEHILGMLDPEVWRGLTGDHGALFGAVIIVAVLWASKLADSKRMDKRHDEMMALQTSNATKLMALTAEAIKAHGLAIQAINSMDRTIQSLTIEVTDKIPNPKKHAP